MSENSHDQRIGPESFRSGSYLYRVSSDNFFSKLVVSSGQQSIAANIEWIMGAGVHGQTYILESKGTLYESQVSFFSGLHGMDITPGHPPTEEGNLQNALGERLSASTGSRCFACHTTASTTKNRFDPKRATPGVTCEACHGPSLSHIVAATMEQRDEAKALILNPRSLSPVDSIDFCGACHRTSVDVVMAQSYGVSNVRFQPYRLEKSRCWKTQADDRLLCIACHNPHEPLVRTASFYDQQCLSCHRLRGEESGRSSNAPGAKASDLVCPKAMSECTNCHMPKYDVPGDACEIYRSLH
ncbi:MAG: multiheme c-type cytochrome [Candidatus Sulfotelmatobacter sp.]